MSYLRTMNHYNIDQLLHESFYFKEYCNSLLRSLFLIYRVTWENTLSVCSSLLW